MTHEINERQFISPGGHEGEQILPVNVYEVENDLVVVAPMPGMEPENINVSITGKLLTIGSSLRGPGQRDRRYIRHEWTYGPYFRRIGLPFPVDAEHANASYNNGVLTLTLPKSASAHSKRILLKKTGTAEGHLEGHIGHHAIKTGQFKDDQSQTA